MEKKTLTGIEAQVEFDSGLTFSNGEICIAKEGREITLDHCLKTIRPLVEAIVPESSPDRMVEDLSWKLMATTDWVRRGLGDWVPRKPSDDFRRYIQTLVEEFSREYPLTWYYVKSVDLWFNNHAGRRTHLSFERPDDALDDNAYFALRTKKERLAACRRNTWFGDNTETNVKEMLDAYNSPSELD